MTASLEATEAEVLVTVTLVPSSTPWPSPTSTPALVLDYEPAGCREPIDSYDAVTLNGMAVNRRTAEMLFYAAELYGGSIDISGLGLTQGSYTDALSASFGTHAGGGAVDLTVFLPGTFQPAYGELGRLIRALRTAGFAAWVRDLDELGPGSPIHIHAIAIGDTQLSPAALDQIHSPEYGYFAGGNALPMSPAPDRFGGPVICNWMKDADGHSIPRRPRAEGAALNLAARLKQTADAFLTDSEAQTLALVGEKFPVPLWSASLANLEGPLAAALLVHGGVIPAEVPLDFAYSRYWYIDRTSDQKPWLLLADAGFEQHSVNIQPEQQGSHLPDFYPGDLMYIHGTADQKDAIRTVTEVDAAGTVWTLSPAMGEAGVTIERVELVSGGMVSNFWQPYLQPDGSLRFEHIYRPELHAAPGSIQAIVVRAGDDLYSLATLYFTTAQSIAALNTSALADGLQVGETLRVPVNSLP